MQVVNTRNPIRLTPHVWWCLAFTLLVSLPLLHALAFPNLIYDLYLAHFVAPELEQTLGFRGGEVTVTDGNSTYPWYGITAVVSGGTFDRAGVRPGDIPVGFVHGARSGLLGLLHHSRGDTVQIRFARPHHPSAGKWPEKTISVSLPAKR